MSRIVKKEWERIEQAMQQSWFNLVFSYKGFDLFVFKAPKPRFATDIAVFVNNSYHIEWFIWNNKGWVPSDKAPKILHDICHVRTTPKYTPQNIQDIEATYGKEAKNLYPDLHYQYVIYDLFYPTALELCCKFKTLKGLTLKSCSSASDELKVTLTMSTSCQSDLKYLLDITEETQ